MFSKERAGLSGRYNGRARMKIINRYVVREMVGPTFLGFAFYTFILLMRELFDAAELIIRRSLPLTEVLVILGLSLPHIVVLTLPMALLFGILIAIGRLSSDSEIVAMRAVGISTNIIYRPVLLFSGFFFILNLLLINVLTPLGNEALVRKTREIASSAIQAQIQPRVFYDEIEDLVVYVDDVDPATNDWKGVFLSSQTDPGRQDIVLADTGEIERTENGELWLQLRNAVNHQYNPSDPDSYHVSQQKVQEISLMQEEPLVVTSDSKSYSEMTIPELREVSRRQDLLPMDRRAIRAEIHKKIAIPFACIAFGIVALPLGITNRRGGRSSGVSVSIGIILLYYIVLSNGEDLARSGTLPPWLGIWLANIILVIGGILLLRRANRDAGRGESRLLAWIGRRIRSIRRRRELEDEPKEKASILSRLDIAFPNTIDRYVLSQFSKILFAVILSTAILFIVVDYTEIADEITDYSVPWEVVLSYYRYFSIQVLDLILPLSVLLATMITFAIFSRNSEVTAMKANGISLYRISIPIVMMAAIASGVSYLLQDFVLPYSNEQVHELKSRIKGRDTARSFGEQRQWIFGNGRYLFNFLEFDQRGQTLKRIQVFEFHPTEFRLTRRVLAEEARWDGIGWVFVNGWIRSFGDDGTRSFTPINRPVRLHYPERPEYFSTEVRTPDQMTFNQLRHYIRDLERSGYDASGLTVELFRKTSWPFVSLVMGLIALPFSFRMSHRTGGALYGIATALFLAFVYWTVFGIFIQLGEVGRLPAVLAAWSANGLFVIAALYMFLSVET